jgi:23S rRNA pseudouridine1911/1915/1917 synthase
VRNIERPKTERLDQYVLRQQPNISRAFAAKLIEREDVLVNGVAQKPGYKVRPDDEIIVNYVPEEHAKVADISLRVLYEDKDCVVIEKPAGVLSHSKGVFNPEATVATWLQNRVKGIEGERAGIVHRLDRATSGVMICAKNPNALSWLQKQFSLRKVKKTYAALVIGAVQPQAAIIDMPIERNPKKPQTFRVGSNGKAATTEYKVIAEGARYSLLELMPTTGRTHQLRVHLTHIGHPIVGDTFYGGSSAAERLYLHAEKLEITLPNRERRTFEVPIPREFKELLQA